MENLLVRLGDSMNVLTIHEIYMILDALKEKHDGREGDPTVQTLRAKLSSMLEMAHLPEELRRPL
jgi:hypothetical protein